jgi:hypothetical protein
VLPIALEVSNANDDSYNTVIAKIFREKRISLMEDMVVLRVRNALYTCMLNTQMEIATMSKEFLLPESTLIITDETLNGGDPIEKYRPHTMATVEQYQKAVNDLIAKV